jgi:hypothetical protein
VGWLRSRWTVVALVPAFFLAGFGIVAALAGGSDEPTTAVAPGATSGEAGPATVTVIQGTSPTETSSAGGSPTSTGDAGGGNGDAATTDDGSSPDGSGNETGGAPPAPSPGVIDIDYGRWEGIFDLGNSEIVPDFGLASVIGEFRYLGGVDCPVGLVRVRGWFYGERGDVVGRAVWESVQSTGEGAEVTPGREPLPFEAYGPSSEAPASAALRFVAVECG